MDWNGTLGCSAFHSRSQSIQPVTVMKINAVVDVQRAIPSIDDGSESEFAKLMTASWYLASPSQNETRPLKHIDQ